MGSLSLQGMLSSSVAKRRFLLRPAEPDWKDLVSEPHESIYFGKTQILNVPVYWNLSKLTNPHIAVVGMTGSGKSFFIKTFITRTNMLWGTDTLILDWSGEYSPWVAAANGKIIDLSKKFSFNILDCRPAKNSPDSTATTPISHISRVISAISTACNLSKNPLALLQINQALKSVYQKAKISLTTPLSQNQKNIPTILDLFKELKLQKPDPQTNIAILAIEKLCSQNSPFLKSTSALNINELTSSGLCSINLSSLDCDEHRSLASLILLQFLKEKMRRQETQSLISPRCIIVVDEAWKITQDENSDLVQILREGRKYSFSLIIASQNPTDISKTILSNCATLLIFRLLNHEYRTSLLNSLNLPQDISSQIEKFPIGRALCRMALKNPGVYDGPFIISKIAGEYPPKKYIILVNKMKFNISKKDFSKKLWQLGLTNTQISHICTEFEKNDSQLHAHLLASSLLAFGLSRSSILSFLRDLSIDDSHLLGIFSQIEARQLGVSPASIVNLVVSDAND